mmetsp:Transcript_2226/g.5069  ORF Transcript_2226/g.5069 Transcript_2226/m.5069 type:complete len:189 (+) Transcript_2226:103-669(+)
MAEDPLECSLLTLDLGNEDVCISTGPGGDMGEAEKMPSRGDRAWDGKEEPEARKAKSSWWRPWRKEDKLSEVSQVSQVIELPLPEPTIASVSTHDDLVAECVTPISLDEGRRREPAISLAVPATEVVAPGSIPSPSNSDTVQKVCGIGGIGIAAASVVRHFSLDPDGASRHEQCPSEATPTVVSEFDG